MINKDKDMTVRQMKTILVLYISINCTFFACTFAEGALKKTEISTSTTPMTYLGTKYETIPFPAVLTPHKKYYIGAVFGLKIISIKADGALLKASEVDVDLDDIDARIGIINSDQYIYRVNINRLYFVREFDGEEFIVDRYALPSVYTEIEITYATRYVDNQLGPVAKVILRGKEEPFSYATGEKRSQNP
jgi:hypothetical protein